MRIDAADLRCWDPAREVRRTALLAQVDVFTAEPFAGNPAAVVLDAHAIPEVHLAGGAARRVRVGGQAVTVLSGALHCP
jgi:predicted PhzF superfamily epimerase YddE/YHI9